MRPGDGRPAEPLVEQLSRREREILALLAQGYTGPEIAEKLSIALSSVRSHLQNLYGKLGVDGKRSALNRARQLGLLGPSPPPPAVEPQRAAPDPSLSAALPPAPTHNLPQQITRFFGREAELAQLKQRLAENRLVTLTGPGGVGKTRLSLRAAEDLLGDFAEGVWFVDLAPLADPALVPQQMAVILGVPEYPGRPILETLTSHLRDRQVLLVLDNCEHLLGACARLADTLLRLCPRVTILATSREPLGIAGEVGYPVPSLSFPDPDHLPVIEGLIDYVAVRLFVDRARLVLPDYQVAPHNAIGLARICQRLDGIPLALEMAAARVNLLTAGQLADRLDDAFRLLTRGSRTALPRQQTLRATIDWSYQLLSPEERLLFQSLSVFAGGCTLEAIEAVCATESANVLDRLAALVAKSMVQADRRQGQEARYRLQELMRQYAHEKLQEAGGSQHLPARHRDYFLAFAETHVPKLRTGERLVWTRKLEADQQNLRMALEWSFTDLTNVDAGPRLVMAMNGLWPSHQENLAWLRRAIAWCQSRTGVTADLYASILGTASRWIAFNDPQTAVPWARQAVDICRGLGPAGKKSLMDHVFDLGWIGMMGLVRLDDVAEALAPFVEAEALLQELGPDKFPAERFLTTMGSLALLRANQAGQQGQYKEARLRAGESSRLYEKARNPWGGYLAQICMGTADINLGEYDQAREHLLAALQLANEIGNPLRQAYVRRWLGVVEFRQADLERALDYCRASLQPAAKMGDRHIVASCLGLLACIRASQGQPELAARLSGASMALSAKLGQQPFEDAALETLLPGWHTRPDQAAIWQAYKDGQAMNAERAVAEALGAAALGGGSGE
jgi:predicted ATPase/DNA-binding CsgD family transcriptional regulator